MRNGAFKTPSTRGANIHDLAILPCPACTDVTEHIRVYRVNNCDIWRCNKCGLGRATVSDFIPQNYYNKDYFDGSYEDGYSDYQGSESILRTEFRKIVDEIAKLVPPGAHVLEVGCAYGFFLLEARHRFRVSGIEIAEEAVRACHAAGLSDVHQGVVSDELLSRIGPVDCIVMLDVIEHLLEPNKDLALLASHLRPGGVIEISTGDFSSWLARVMGPRWRLMTPPQHLWYFTPDSLKKLAQGLSLEFRSVRHPWKLVPIGLIAFQARRILRSEMTLNALNMQSTADMSLSQKKSNDRRCPELSGAGASTWAQYHVPIALVTADSPDTASLIGLPCRDTHLYYASLLQAAGTVQSRAISKWCCIDRQRSGDQAHCRIPACRPNRGNPFWFVLWLDGLVSIWPLP